MGNFLAQLLGMEDAPNPSALPPARTYSPKMEKLARARGFRNAAQMDAWVAQRNRPSGGAIGKGTQAPAGLDTAMSWHPKNIFEKILGRWQGAMDK